MRLNAHSGRISSENWAQALARRAPHPKPVRRSKGLFGFMRQGIMPQPNASASTAVTISSAFGKSITSNSAFLSAKRNNRSLTVEPLQLLFSCFHTNCSYIPPHDCNGPSLSISIPTCASKHTTTACSARRTTNSLSFSTCRQGPSTDGSPSAPTSAMPCAAAASPRMRAWHGPVWPGDRLRPHRRAYGHRRRRTEASYQHDPLSGERAGRHLLASQPPSSDVARRTQRSALQHR